MSDTRHFPPTLAAARERIAALNLDRYARTRNALTGAVSGLSPYITHGFVTLPDIVQALRERQPLDPQHKFVYELGWREYSRHLWRVHGDGIFSSLHPGVLPDAGYSPALPDDLREARTGVPAIDRAVRTLYESGYLHNHARMWLASYTVHLRKVHWRAGADWMVAHLLDGDLGSNHPGWQWIAGTASSKPYLFNAENVARFAPAAWHSPGTVIDTSYEALDSIARTPGSASAAVHAAGIAEPPTFAAPPAPAAGALVCPPDPSLVAGRDVWLVHAWALRAPPPGLAADTLLIGVIIAEYHRQWPWSQARWNFVCSRMQQLTQHCWYAAAASIAAALRAARTVTTVANPHLSLGDLETLHIQPAPRLFAEIDQTCSSFSQWWARASTPPPPR